jgi:hypothetical protein
MRQALKQLDDQFVEDGIVYDIVLRNKHWAVVAQDAGDASHFIVGAITERNGREHFDNPRKHEVYTFEFATEDKAIEAFLQLKDSVLV